jgi:hypothetical protein
MGDRMLSEASAFMRREYGKCHRTTAPLRNFTFWRFCESGALALLNAGKRCGPRVHNPIGFALPVPDAGPPFSALLPSSVAATAGERMGDEVLSDARAMFGREVHTLILLIT